MALATVRLDGFMFHGAMRNGTCNLPADACCAGIAAGQAGVLSIRQARGCGMTPSRISRLRKAGRWDSPFPRTLRYLATPRTDLQRYWLVHCWLGDEMAFSGGSAAWLMRLGGFRARPIHVLTTKFRKDPPSDIVLHRVPDLTPSEIFRVDGLPVTLPSRTIFDLPRTSTRRQTASGLDELLRRGATSLPKLSMMLESRFRGHPGASVIRCLIQERMQSGPSQTDLERELRPLLAEAGLPWPVAQYEIRHEGRLIAIPDFAVPDVKLAIEADGYLAHSSLHDFSRDRHRDPLLVSLGWTILRFDRNQILNQPNRVVALCRRTWSRLTA